MGASDIQTADIAARHDTAFNSEYQKIKEASSRYNNPQDLITSFLNFKAFGDATYQEPKQSPSPDWAYSQKDILSSNPVSAGLKTAANVGQSFVRTPLEVGIGMAKMPFTDTEGNISAYGGAKNVYENLLKKPAQAVVDYGMTAGKNIYEGITGNKVTNPQLTEAQQRVDQGFLNQAVGLGDLLKGDYQTAAQKTVKTLQEDPGKIALILSPLTHPATLDLKTGLRINPETGAPAPGILGPISKISDVVGQGIDYAATKLKESADTSIKATKEAFVKKLVSPKESPSVKLDQTMRTKDVGTGPFKRSVVEPTKREVQMAQAVSDLPLNPKGTYQENLNIIKDANIAEAEGLKTSLEMNDFSYSPSELQSRLNAVKTELKNNPVLVGDAAKVAQKLIEELNRRIKASPKTGSSLLQIRKDLDTWVEQQKGSSVFDPARENAFSAALRPIRRAINDFLETKAPNAGVKASLAKQSALYDVMDNVAPKASLEANSAWERTAQRIHAISGKLRLGPTGVGVTGVAGAYGLYAAPQLAAIIGGVAAGSYFIYKAGKMLMSPKLRIATSNVLHILEKVAIDNPAMYPDVAPIIQDINTMNRGEIPTPKVHDMTVPETGLQGRTSAVQESTQSPTLPPETPVVKETVPKSPKKK